MNVAVIFFCDLLCPLASLQCQCSDSTTTWMSYNFTSWPRMHKWPVVSSAGESCSVGSAKWHLSGHRQWHQPKGHRSRHHRHRRGQEGRNLLLWDQTRWWGKPPSVCTLLAPPAGGSPKWSLAAATPWKVSHLQTGSFSNTFSEKQMERKVLLLVLSQ